MSPSQKTDSPYIRLQRDLGEMISNAAPGEKLPTEPDLAKQMGVSRSTLREAMRSFETQGLLIRRQGAGTFVADTTHVFETGLEVLESLESIAKRIGLEISMGKLTIEKTKSNGHFSHIFGIADDIFLLSVCRVIYAKDQPAAYLRDILLPDMLNEEELQVGFTGSVLDLLISKGKPVLEQSRTEIKVIPAPYEVAHALDIQRGDGLLMFESDLVAKNGDVIVHSYSYFLSGYFRFHVVRKIGII